MSREDHKTLAMALHRSRPDPSPRLDGPIVHPLMTDVWEKTRNEIADVLALDHRGFDRDQFVEATYTGRWVE